VTAVASGLVLVDKPAGWTSHDVVARVRRLAGTRRVGHAGTLDPMATGVLVLGVERATRLLTFLVGVDKTYTGTIRLGAATVTDDAEGEVTATTDAGAVTDQAIAAGVRALTGGIEQVPSAVSAIKVDGQRSYARVRAGEDVVLNARPVTVHRFEVLATRRGTGPTGLRVVDLDVEVECTSGTYIRALARDLGAGLRVGGVAVGGHLTALRRTRVGPYGLDVARPLRELEQDFRVLPLAETARVTFPTWLVDHEVAAKLVHGQQVPAPPSLGRATPEQPAAAFDPEGALVALVARTAGGLVRPMLVIPPD
jgi:tRNA pseudouridine55 synthase